MTVTVLKKTLQKLRPQFTYYRDNSKFSTDNFRGVLWSKLYMENISNTSNGRRNLLQICIGVQDKLEPQKKKYNRSNNMPFMNKPLVWAHMKRNHLRNRFKKNRSEVNIINYIKQRNCYYCVSLLRKMIKKKLRKSK